MLALVLLLAAGSPAGSPDPDVATRLLGGALSDGIAFQRLTELTDGIGPRLSGSPGAEAAVKWGLSRMKEDGLAARLEPVKVPHWVRGHADGEILAGNGHAAFPLAITALGGSVGTPAGGITAEVIEAWSLEQIAALGDKARGKIVFLNHEMGTNGGYGDWAVLRGKGPAEAAKVGALAVVIRSLATASLRSPHTGATTYEEGVAKIPAAALATEDGELIHRLLQRGAVRIRLGLGCRILPDADSANVVAELRGREAPDEVVLIGAHLDSWDLAQGAEDDGAGVALVMEAGRLLARLPKPPRRTVRVVLFMNEENGLQGAKAYAAAHKDELPRHVAAIEMDSGGARAVGVTVKSLAGAGALLDPWLQPLKSLGIEKAKEGDAGGADLTPLRPSSVPMVSVNQDGTHYFELHHSAADTLDHIDPKELAQAAAAVAWVTYALAEMPAVLPRPPAEPEHGPAHDTPAAKKH